MKYGLLEKDIQKICKLLEEFSQIEEALLFGSRVLNLEKKGSDIDLALKGRLNLSLVAKIKAKLEETLSLPYFFDVIDYETITNPDLKEHIDTYGEVLYRLKN